MNMATDTTTTPGMGVAHSQHSLPEEPLISIRPSRAWVALNLRDLWAYRELLYFLTRRDVKVRYKQTVLGAAWAIIQPLSTMLIFTLFFSKLANVPSGGIPISKLRLCGFPRIERQLFFSAGASTGVDRL
jgi:lipopolysaccharide transport system permease protein